MVGPGEIARRARGRVTGRLESLPILALSVHSACNCRCVMCDIWKANAERREISPEDLSRHIEAIRGLRVERVMLTGGEPLLHRNLWALCSQLQALRIRITLVTTGLLLETHARDVAACVDTVVVSLDGPRAVHDRIRRVSGGFDRVAKGLMAIHARTPTPRLIARSVVQRENAGAIAETIAAARHMGFDEISFLAADVSSPAFNRPSPWPESRARAIALDAQGIAALEAAIDSAVIQHRGWFDHGFIAGGRASLDRIAQYFRAILGTCEFPKVHCNAPWVSAVLEPGGTLRPCFFQEEYGSASEHLEHALNGDRAVDFRRRLDVAGNDTCRRCVCSLNLPLTSRA
ncbi:MAG TPA: radical SAM protein [Vicinamibacterales bacterium]|nr:radical SAM protein [Vicinamibacterales bacterium]